MTFVTHTTAPSRASLDWRKADDDVFVATLAGEYAGFVGVTPRGFEAHGARGEDLGVHAAHDLANRAVAASVTRLAPRPRATRAPYVRSEQVGTAPLVAHAARKVKGKTRWPLAP